MRILRLSLIALALAATAACNDKGGKDAGTTPPAKPAPRAAAPPSTELVSLAWKPANANQNLQSIELTLTGADIVSVCRTPPGWVLKAESGRLKGYATVGAGFISVDDLEDLEGLFLIRHHAGEAFGVDGKLLTGVYADDGGQSEIKATPSLLSGRPAEQCPPAKG
jgi:glucose/arabinose dehydrogenase